MLTATVIDPLMSQMKELENVFKLNGLKVAQVGKAMSECLSAYKKALNH